jgi:hypothetical protein
VVDTGADSTVLMPLDAGKLGLDYTKLTGGVQTIGVGGLTQMFREPGAVMFLEGTRKLHLYFVDINIASPTPDITDVPSLLGRDVLDHWRMHYNPSTGTLTFKVNAADRTLTV